MRVENRRLFDVGPRGAASAQARATRINRRLQNLIEREAEVLPFSPAGIRRAPDGLGVSIGGVSILTVSAQDAADAGQSARQIALLQGAAMTRAVIDARASRKNVLRGAGILIANSLRDLMTAFLRWLPRVFAAMLLFGVFWLAARGARLSARHTTNRLGFDPNLRALVLALSFYGVWFVGTLAILSALGFDGSSLAAAVGVSGFVLGFAFKDILAHFLAGILLLASGKIRIGDQIVVREFEGTVERIELRALELRTDDNRLVIIPNGDVFSAAITSASSAEHRRRSFVVPVPHELDIAQTLLKIAAAVQNTPGVLETPAPEVTIEVITREAVIVRARFSTALAHSDALRVSSEALKAVKSAFGSTLGALPVPAPAPAPPVTPVHTTRGVRGF